jgi:hypothetical protein
MAFREPKKWADLFPAAEWWYNSSYNTAIKQSPCEALYGYAPPQIGEISLPCNVTPDTHISIQAQEEMMKSLQQNLLQA